MKANVFSEESSDGTVTIFTLEYDVSVKGYDMQDACKKFVRAWRDKYFVDFRLVEAN